jgi:uncharacterized membrane protein
VNTLLKYFLRGLLFLVPISITLYIIVASIQWLDNLIPAIDVPFLGLFIILFIITVFGYLGTTLLAKPIFDIFEDLLTRLPLVNIIYTSLKDLISAFVGDKKKFNKPVLVSINPGIGLQKLGFITQNDLHNIGLPGKVAVYLPHSYNFSGNLFIVAKEMVFPIDAPSSDVMKFIISGGVSGMHVLDEEVKDVQQIKNL